MKRLAQLNIQCQQGIQTELILLMQDLIQQENEVLVTQVNQHSSQAAAHVELLCAVQQHHQSLETITIQDREVSGVDLDFDQGHMYMTLEQPQHHQTNSNQLVIRLS